MLDAVVWTSAEFEALPDDLDTLELQLDANSEDPITPGHLASARFFESLIDLTVRRNGDAPQIDETLRELMAVTGASGRLRRFVYQSEGGLDRTPLMPDALELIRSCPLEEIRVFIGERLDRLTLELLAAIRSLKSLVLVYRHLDKDALGVLMGHPSLEIAELAAPNLSAAENRSAMLALGLIEEQTFEGQVGFFYETGKEVPALEFYDPNGRFENGVPFPMRQIAGRLTVYGENEPVSYDGVIEPTSGGRDWSDLGIERTQEDALPALLRTHVWKAGCRAYCPFEPGAETDVFVFGAT